MSGVGAEVVEEQVPVHDDATEMRKGARTPLEHALHDGEDYELLFTLEPAAWARVVANRLNVSVIGRITATPGVWLRRRDGTREALEAKGWEHTL
jgi:thiamine-monophosphate kinase